MAANRCSQRIHAFALHLGFSAAIAGSFAAATYFVWYPAPLLDLQGGILIIALLLGVDTILGPALTLLIFNPRKPRKELLADLAVIVTVQLAAFTYGATIIYGERPAYVAFAHSQFFVVRGEEAVGQPPPSVMNAPRYGVFGPRIVMAQIPEEQLRNGTALIASVTGDPSFALEAKNYRPFPIDPAAVLREAMNSTEVLSVAGTQITRTAARLGADLNDLAFFQIKGRTRSGIALIDQKALNLIGIVDFDLRKHARQSG